MNYKDTISYLYEKLPMYQRSGSIAYKKDIGNIIKASEILGNPHLDFKSIHIAGTNGKGSTSHMISSVLQEAGYKVGLYTSPHLKDFRERIKINGNIISKRLVINFIKKHKSNFEKIHMSFFELTVAMAFNYFSEENIDIAVIECGLGGRLDSTNIILPEVSVITNISLDHTDLLGDTLEKIALEKSGIIKENTPVIIGRKQKETKRIFEQKASKENSKIIYAKNFNYKCDLKGHYQKENIDTAITTIKNLDKFKIDEKDIKKGLNNIVKNTSLQGRWQIISNEPLIICDTAHNIDGLNVVVNQINKIQFNNLHFIIGLVNDKNIDSILSILPKKAYYYFCQAKVPRAMNKTDLQTESKKFNLKGEIFPSVKKALNQAKKRSKRNDLIFVGGSTFVVAEII